jgi:hypothetical protein
LPFRAVELRACLVEPIPRGEAAPFIRRFEHLGSTGQATLWFGLRAPDGRLLGVVGFGHGPHAAGRGADAVLERGACAPGAPRNAASFRSAARFATAAGRSAGRMCAPTLTRGSAKPVLSIAPSASSNARHPGTAMRSATGLSGQAACSVIGRSIGGSAPMLRLASPELRSCGFRLGSHGDGRQRPIGEMIGSNNREAGTDDRCSISRSTAWPSRSCRCCARAGTRYGSPRAGKPSRLL